MTYVFPHMTSLGKVFHYFGLYWKYLKILLVVNNDGLNKCQSFYIRRKYSLGWIKKQVEISLLEFSMCFLKSIF